MSHDGAQELRLHVTDLGSIPNTLCGPENPPEMISKPGVSLEHHQTGSKFRNKTKENESQDNKSSIKITTLIFQMVFYL